MVLHGYNRPYIQEGLSISMLDRTSVTGLKGGELETEVKTETKSVGFGYTRSALLGLFIPRN